MPDFGRDTVLSETVIVHNTTKVPWPTTASFSAALQGAAPFKDLGEGCLLPT